MRSIFTLLLATIALNALSQTTITAKAGTGDWDKTVTWDKSQIPTNNDIVIIPATSTVLIKGDVYKIPVPAPNLTIQIAGSLEFQASGKLNLGTNSTIQLLTGTATITSQNPSNSQMIVVNGITKYNAGIDGTLTGPKYASSSTAASGSLASGFSFGVLPVKLLSFTVQAKANQVLLKWST